MSSDNDCTALICTNPVRENWEEDSTPSEMLYGAALYCPDHRQRMESRVDKVTAQYFRSGRCKVCGGSAERLKSFSSDTMEKIEAMRDAWQETPLVHKRCEGQPIP